MLLSNKITTHRPRRLNGFYLETRNKCGQKYDRFQGFLAREKNGKQRVFEDLESAMLKGGP